MKTENSKGQIFTSVVVLALFAAAFILATLITPSTLHAQQGGGGGGRGNENSNCPSYTTNVAPSCPSITNGMSLSPMSFCVKLGDDLPDPSWTPPGPGATPGSVVTTITETCSNTVTSSTNNVSYSFGWHYDAPGKPPKPTTAGTVTSPICWGTVTSSDTNDCSPDSSQTPINLGVVTWYVIDPHPNTVAVGYDASVFENAIDGFFSHCPGNFIKDITITVGTEGSKETGQECCPTTGAPDNYAKYSGSVSAKCSVDVVVPGWSWDGGYGGTTPFLYLIDWNATLGPTITLTPGGTIALSGKTTDPDCGSCFTGSLNGSCGLALKLGATASATVQLFESGHWYSVNDTFTVDISGEASTSASAGGQYSTGTDCGTSGLSGATFSIGGVDLTGTAQLTVDGTGFSFTHTFHAWDGWSYP